MSIKSRDRCPPLQPHRRFSMRQFIGKATPTSGITLNFGIVRFSRLIQNNTVTIPGNDRTGNGRLLAFFPARIARPRLHSPPVVKEHRQATLNKHVELVANTNRSSSLLVIHDKQENDRCSLLGRANLSLAPSTFLNSTAEKP